MPNQKHREGLFLLLCLAAAGICAGLAFRFAVPLPGVGPRNAQAILDYRAQYGPFAQVEDAAQVPGITQAMVDSWAGQAYVR